MKKEKSHSFKGKIVASAEKQKKSKGGRGYISLPQGVEFFKIPENVRSIKLDFLPYIVTSKNHPEKDEKWEVALPGSPWYRLPIRVHTNVGADNERVICRKTFGGKCPICDYQLKRIKEGADKEEFKLLYPQERSLYIVIPIGVKDLEEKPYVWDMSDFLFQETLIEELQEDPDNEDFFTLDNGKTAELKLKWKEIGKNNFPEVVSIVFSDRDPYEDDIMEEIPSLDDCVKVLSAPDMEAKFFDLQEEDAGKIEEEEEEEEEDTPPTSRRRKQNTPPAGRRSRKVEDEPKEEEEEEEEEENTPPPTRSSRKRTPAPAPEPEEEEEQEEQEEEPPTKAVRKGKTSDGDKCPYGHKFGVDTDKFPKDCDKCDIWDDCIEEFENKQK